MKKRFLPLIAALVFGATSFAQTAPCYGPNEAVNGDFQTYTGAIAQGNTWINNNLDNWSVSHGTPSANGNLAIWMWSYSDYGEGVYTDYNFVAGQEYQITYDLFMATDANPTSEFFVRLNNNLTPSASGNAIPATTGTQVVSNVAWNLSGTTTTITETFIAGSNYSQLWFYPYLAGSATPNQASCTIDNITISQAIACPCTVSPIFEYQQVSGCVYEFFDQSSAGSNPNNQIIGYKWDFGDGVVSTDQNPTHNFTAPGTYNVCLTVWGANGTDCCSDTYCDSIVIVDPCNPCDFIQNVVPELAYVGTSDVDFSATNTANDFPGAMGFYWDFGDGTYGSGENVTHTYAGSGSYTACLVVYYQDPVSGDCCNFKTCLDVALEANVGEINGETGSLELFPNPSNGSTTVKIKKDVIESVEIYSLSGQLIDFPTEFSKGNKQAKINTSSFAAGVYMVLIEGETGIIYSKKLIVN